MTALQSLEDKAAHLRQAKEQEAIEALAKQTSTDIEFVRTLYIQECARLESQAKVKTFLSVIATRLVRNALTQKPYSQIQ